MVRVEILSFRVASTDSNGNSLNHLKVTTDFKITKIPTTNTGITSSTAIQARITTDSFKTDVLANTITAIGAQPSAEWTADSVFRYFHYNPLTGTGIAPSDDEGASSTSLFYSHNAT